MIVNRISTQLCTLGLALVIAIVVSSCNSMVKSNKEQTNLLPESKTTLDMGCDDLLDYYEMIFGMPVEMRVQELDDLRKKVQHRDLVDRKSCYQLQLSLLLTQQGAGIEDYEEANQILENFMYDTRNDNTREKQFALLLLAHVNQGRTLLRRNYDLEMQVKNEQIVSVKHAKKLSELQSQLDQLKDIEKNINEKEQSITVPSIDNNPHE